METITLIGADMKSKIAAQFVRSDKKYTLGAVNGPEVLKEFAIVNAKDGTKIVIHD